MKPHLPQALKLSLATLLAGSVYVMQNAEHYASKITDTDLPGAESGTRPNAHGSKSGPIS